MSQGEPFRLKMENKPFDGHVHKLVKLYRTEKGKERMCIRCGLVRNQIYFNEEDGEDL